MKPNPFKTHNRFWFLKVLSPFRFWIFLSFFLGVLTIGSSIGLMMSAAFIISFAALQPSIAALQVAIVGVRFFGISRGVYRYLERLTSHLVTFKVLARLRLWFFSSIESAFPYLFANYKYGDLINRSVSDIDFLDNLILRLAYPPMIAFLVSIAMLIIFSFFHVWLSLILLVAYTIAGVVLPLVIYLQSTKINQHFISLRSTMNELLVDYLHGRFDLIAFGMDHDYRNKILQTNHQLETLQRKTNFYQIFYDGVISSLLYLTLLAVLIIAIPLVNLTILTGIQLAVVVIGIMASFEIFLPVPAAFLHLDSQTKALARIHEIIEKKPVASFAASGKSSPTASPPLLDNMPISISIESVSFQFANQYEPAIDSLTCRISQPECVALVGNNGSGKTTFVNLLTKQLPIQQGSITINQQSYESLSQEEVLSKITLVQQSVHLFNGTLRDNLLVDSSGVGSKHLEQALHQVGLIDYIQSLPEGLDTWIGEGGIHLSGGERQKLGIARALLRETPIVIFDEPFAHLDAKTTDHLWHHIQHLKQDKLVVVITHDMEYLPYFNRILVMESGKLVEEGSYQDLIRNKGVFWHKIQAHQEMHRINELIPASRSVHDEIV